MSEYIDRNKVIDALESTDWYHQNRNKDMVHGANSFEHQAWYREQDVYAAINSISAADVVAARDFRDGRNELCLKCGAYKERHIGACDGCRWRVKTDDLIDRSQEEIRV